MDGKLGKLVTVIIVNYNGLKSGYLQECLRSVYGTEYPNLEVVFVDNASKDGSLEYVAKSFPRAKIVANSKNLGFAEGNNIAMREAGGQYIALLNYDTKVSPSWLSDPIRILESQNAVAAIACKLLSFDDPKKIDGAGGIADVYGFPTERGRAFGSLETDTGQYDEISEVFYASGSAMILRKNALREVGFFDPKFFMYFEDMDFCWRLRLKGYKVLFVPNSIVYHRRRLRAPEPLSYDLLYHYHKNHLATLVKNCSYSSLAKMFPFFVAVKIFIAIRHLMNKKPMATKDVLSGLFWNLKELRYVLRQRLIVQRIIRTVQEKDIRILLETRSLAVDYVRSR